MSATFSGTIGAPDPTTLKFGFPYVNDSKVPSVYTGAPYLYRQGFRTPDNAHFISDNEYVAWTLLYMAQVWAGYYIRNTNLTLPPQQVVTGGTITYLSYSKQIGGTLA